MKAVITVVGRDTVGVVAKISGVCAQLNINIQDVTQSILQEMFCMIMLVDMSRCAQDTAQVRLQLDELAQSMGMEIHLTRQEVFDAMHRI